jgi:hypothetical protein
MAHPKGTFSYYAKGEIFVPDRLITKSDVSGEGSRYCALALRGYGHTRAVVDTSTKRAIGFTTTDSSLYNTVLRQCGGDDELSGARRRKRRRR